MEAVDKPDPLGVEKESGCSMIIYEPTHSFQETGHQGAEVGPWKEGS